MNRRNFLRALSTSALVGLAPNWLEQVEARVRGTSGPLFNGGKSQVNFAVLGDASGEFPFINHMLTGQEWSTVVGNSPNFDPSTLDANGYPTSIISGGVYSVVFIPTQAERAGNYTISFDAAGAGAQVTIPGVGTYTAVGAGTTTGTLAAASLSTLEATEFSVQGTRTYCRLVVQVTATGVSNLQIFHVNDTAARAAAIAKGYAWGGFGVDFLARIRANKWAVLRFLNWQSNYNYMAKWSLRKPTSYYTFKGRQVVPLLVLGAASGTGNTFAINGNGTGVPATGDPSDKQQIIFQANHTGTSAANTLALNGGTAFPIKRVDDSTTTLQLQNGVYYCATFDSTLASWLIGISNSGSTNISPGIFDGCPPEVMIALCYEVGAHPWLIAPWLSFMTPSLYMTPLAQYIKTTYVDSGLAPWMIPRFEGPNEQWNSGFFASGYSGQYAIAVYGSASPSPYDHSWYGVGLSQMGQAINAVYGSPNAKTQTSYQIICGIQSSTFTSPSSSNARLNTTRTPSATSGGSAPYNWVTHVACTGYINPNTQNKQEEFAYAFDYYFTYAANPTQRNVIATAYANDCNVITATFTGTITGTSLAISGLSGTFYSTGVGTILGAGVTPGTRVLSGSGPYTVNNSQNVGPVSMEMHGLLTAYQAWQAWGASFSNPVVKLTEYEGSWSPDFAATTSGHCYVQITGATKTNPCVLSISTTGSNFFKAQNDTSGKVQNLQSYPSGANNVWIFVPFTGAWAGLAGYYKITSGNDTSITINLDATAQASNFASTITGEYQLSYSTGTATVSGTTLTVSGQSGDPIVVGSTVFYSGVNFSGINGYPKVASFGSGTGGNGTYTLDRAPGNAGPISAEFLVECGWMVNVFRWASRGVSAMQSITYNNYRDLTVNTTGGEFPSEFTLGSDGIWSLYWPSIYSTPSPQQLGIFQFNS